jgi:hypothetical protein
VRWRRKYFEDKAAKDDLAESVRALQAALKDKNQELERTRCRIAELEKTAKTLQAPAPQVRLPDDPLPHYHQYGSRLMALSVNLARAVGFRGAVRVLRLVRDWLGVQLAIPTWQTIRDWMRRMGLAMIKRAGKVQRATWIVDHSNQIGTEKLLVVLRVCRPHWTGNALGRQDVELIGLIPKTGWKAADVGKAYQQLAKQYGVPEAILVDGAAELRDGAEYLRKTGRKVLIRRDLKHFLANQMGLDDPLAARLCQKTL